MIRNYLPGDAAALLRIWNSAGARAGFAPLDAEDFDKILLHNPDFSPEFTFVLEENGEILGFCNGCTGEHIYRGSECGYVSCVLVAEEADNAANTAALLDALEKAFRDAGRSCAVVSCFNPIRLPWIIPGTQGHQHNNAPGIGVDIALYERMLARDYREVKRERAMYMDLSGFETPAWIEEKAARMAQKGRTVERYDPSRHVGLDEMVASLNNSMWSAEIPQAGRSGMDLLVAVENNVCAGFTGPVYPEKTGRGYFAGVAVAPQFEKRGFGTLLFYRLLKREKETGAKYMSLFTGEHNHAGQIYIGAGFRVVRWFSVMQKDL